MKLNLEKSWHSVLKDELSSEYYLQLLDYLKNQYAEHICYPPKHLIFEAFEKCPFNKVKVVILGQDPYINPNQAHGLSFSVPPGAAIPPSLRNIFKELQSDLKVDVPFQGDLTRWAEQGVLLLNSTLTVQAGISNSHKGCGWERFTNAVIEVLNTRKTEIVYMLWGAFAQKKAKTVNPKLNLVLKSVHPSPLSAYRGFFGCQHFSKANEYLTLYHKTPIQW
ncbi:MAG: uracil-DNA glycosylase [Flavobacteriales bacterium]